MNLIKIESKGSFMKLSRRECEVLTCIAYGLTDKEIAKKLKISSRTVGTHVSSILLKLRAKNRANAVIVYMFANPKWKIKIRNVV